jgi:hypothetical protein
MLSYNTGQHEKLIKNTIIKKILLERIIQVIVSINSKILQATKAPYENIMRERYE